MESKNDKKKHIKCKSFVLFEQALMTSFSFVN